MVSYLNFLQLLGHLLLVAKKVAEKKKLDCGYRIGKLHSLLHALIFSTL